MAALLSLAGLRKQYWRGAQPVPVLEGASVDVDSGEWVCVLGERGAGKTTLLQIVAGIARADGGSVIYRGEDLTRTGERRRSQLRRREIACAWSRRDGGVYQERVLEHVALPLLSAGATRRAAGRAAAAMLARVGVSSCSSARLADLADAERIRVALAQACIREPRLLLADALTDTLDMTECHAVLGLLDGFARDGVTILMTAASGHGAHGAHRLMRLSSGRLVEARSERAEVVTLPLPGNRRSEA